MLKTTDKREEQFRIYVELADAARDFSDDSCLYYLRNAEKLLPGTNSLRNLGEYYRIRGSFAWAMNNFDEAVRLFRISVFCFEKTGERKGQMNPLNLIGAYYAQSGNSSEALKYYLKCKEIAEESKSTDMMARLNNNIGRIYIASENYQKGIDYYKKALSVFEKGTDTFKIATVYMNLGSAYQHLDKSVLSRECLDKATRLFKLINRTYYVGNSLMIYSFTLFYEKRYTEALDYLTQALAIAQVPPLLPRDVMPSKLLLSDVEVYTGITWYMTGDFIAARRFLLQGYHLADSLKLLKSIQIATQYLSMTYEKRKQTDSAFFYFKEYKELSDTLHKIESINIVKLAEVQMEYDKDVNDKKMQLAYAERIRKSNLVLFIGAAAFLVALVIILMLKLRIENQKKKHIEFEKRQAELEKIAADQQLEARNKELASKVIHSTKINELVLGVAEKLKKMEVGEGSVNARIRNELINELINSTNKDDSWKEFEMRFQNVHTEFYQRLREKFPDLTTNEIRLSALLRLNMTTKEISALTHQSDRAIVLSRHRLRHKLGLQTSDNLVVFLSQF